MPKRIRLPFSSTKTRSRGGNSARRAAQAANLLPALYLTLDELPLDKFIVCVCDEDLTALVKDKKDIPNVTPEELITTWNDLFLDYVDLSKEAQTRYRITLKRDIALFTSRVQRIESALVILGTPLFIKRLADIVQEIKGFEDITLDPTDMDKYFSDLQLIRDRSREMKIDADLKKIELEELIKSEAMEEQKRADKLSFLNILARIATYRKVAVIRTSELTVAEFCAAFNEYLDYIEAVKVSLSKTKKAWN